MAGFLITSLQKRAASALVLIPVTLFVLYYGGLLFAVLLALLAVMSLYEWAQMAHKTKNRLLYLLFGIVYISISFYCCYFIRSFHPLSLSVLFLCMIWSSDIGAYLVGKTVRGPKMASEVSPNKTWSGYSGALLFPGLVSVVFMNVYAVFLDGGALPSLTGNFHLFVVGVIIGLVGQSGDLVVSYVKRAAHVKDTGALIPGHGGLLDRIDSLLLAAPVFLFFITKYAYVFSG